MLFDSGNSVLDVYSIYSKSMEPLSLERGRFFLSVMSDIGYSVINVGEAEYLLGYESLLEMAKSRPKAVSANLVSKADAKQPFPPFEILTAAGKYRLLITGVFPETSHFAVLEKLKKDSVVRADAAQAVSDILSKNKERFDFSIVLSPMTIEENKRLASRVPDIDMILGSKDYPNDTVLIQDTRPLLIPLMPKGPRFSILSCEIISKEYDFVKTGNMEKLKNLLKSLDDEMAHIRNSREDFSTKRRMLSELADRRDSVEKELGIRMAFLKNPKKNRITITNTMLDSRIPEDTAVKSKIESFMKKTPNPR